MQKSMALTATEFINEHLLNIILNRDFFGKLYKNNIQKHYYTILVQLVNSEILYKLFWHESTQINHNISTDIITFTRNICV